MGSSGDSTRQPRPLRQTRRFHAGRVALRSPRLNARLLNLSAGGAAIESSDPPRIGSEVICEIISDQTSALIPGEVRWCRLGATASDEAGEVIPVYRAGIRFINGTPHNLLRILRAAGLRRADDES